MLGNRGEERRGRGATLANGDTERNNNIHLENPGPEREDDNGNRARDYDPGLNAARSINLVTRFIAIVLRFPAKSS